MDKYTVLSLGWGVQSFTLAAMAALGEIEKPDVLIHADTTYEFSGTYEFARQWTPWLEAHGLTVATVKNKYPVVDTCATGKFTYIPAFTLWNGAGQIRRQCTGHWKIMPMRQYIQKHREKKPVEMWLGISTDEFQRMRDSEVKYIINRYPLIEKKMSRNDCKNWLLNRNLSIPPRSACVFCPFHTTKDWRYIKASKKDWDEALSVDNAIRKTRPPYEAFVHPSRKPLEDVDFRTMEEKGQMRLWDEECSGICGV